jgi:ribosomal protein L19
MSNTHNNRYDEIKSLLKKSRMLLEQSDEQAPNIAKDIEDKIDQDEDEYETADMEPGDDIEDDEDTPTSVKDKVQKYRISGGILALHGKGKTDTDITTDDKLAFQETMDEFVNEVSDLVDFNTLNVYPNNVDWSGKIIDEDIDFTFTIGEDSGI